MANAPVVLDDRGSPSLQEDLAGLLTRAAEADFAIGRIRLAGLDLPAAAFGRLRRCRVLVGRLDADTFAETAETLERVPARRPVLERLAALLAAGRMEVGACGGEAWQPDFSVLRGLDGEPGSVALLGPHYFIRPYPTGGPAFTCIVPGARAAALAGERFDELWERAHDVAPVLREELATLLAAPRSGGSC